MTFSQNTRMSEDVNDARIEYMALLLSNVLWGKGLQKYVKCYKWERFYNAELLCEEADVIYQLHKNRVRYSCLIIFKLSLTICDTIFFADKNKVNSIHFS
jgi:hypothetical protein